MQLPKPLYEALPYFLLAVGTVFVVLVVKRYQYAPTLFILLLGMLCILSGVFLIVIRLMYRRRHADDE